MLDNGSKCSKYPTERWLATAYGNFKWHLIQFIMICAEWNGISTQNLAKWSYFIEDMHEMNERKNHCSTIEKCIWVVIYGRHIEGRCSNGISCVINGFENSSTSQYLTKTYGRLIDRGFAFLGTENVFASRNVTFSFDYSAETEHQLQLAKQKKEKNTNEFPKDVLWYERRVRSTCATHMSSCAVSWWALT